MQSTRFNLGIITLFCLFVFGKTYALDTLRLSIDETQSRFAQQNLTLLANHFNIDFAKAQTLQAGLRPNPTFSAEGNLFNPQGNHFFSWFGENGMNALHIDQLLRTAHKRNKLVDIARLNEKLNENQFFDLLRTLNATVRQDFYNIHYLENGIAVLNAEIASVSNLLTTTKAAVQAGTVPQKEQLRLEILLFSLQSDRSTKVQTLNDTEAELKTLIVVEPTVYVTPSVASSLAMTDANFTALKMPTPDSLYALALTQRTDLKVAENLRQIAQANLTYQKALKTPDVTVGVGYQSTGNFTPNYTGITASLPLMIFDKNQGNIKAAEIQVKQQEAVNQSIYYQTRQDIFNTVVKFQEYQNLKTQSGGTFFADFQTMMGNMVTLYKDRQVTLTQLIDFMESFKDNKLKALDLDNSLIQTKEHLNFIVGKAMF